MNAELLITSSHYGFKRMHTEWRWMTSSLSGQRGPDQGKNGDAERRVNAGQHAEAAGGGKMSGQIWRGGREA